MAFLLKWGYMFNPIVVLISTLSLYFTNFVRYVVKNMLPIGTARVFTIDNPDCIHIYEKFLNYMLFNTKEIHVHVCQWKLGLIYQAQMNLFIWLAFYITLQNISLKWQESALWREETQQSQGETRAHLQVSKRK